MNKKDIKTSKGQMELIVIREEDRGVNKIKFRRVNGEVVINCTKEQFDEIWDCVRLANKRRGYQRSYLQKNKDYEDIKPRKKTIEFQEI